MSEEAAPDGRSDRRVIDREIAIQILHFLDRYVAIRTGDVKKLKPPPTGLRLRCGDYNAIEISGVCNRRDAYR